MAREQTFQERLHAAARRAGIQTQREIAELTGIHTSYINRLWKGDIEEPTYPIAAKLARALGVPVGELVPEYGVPAGVVNGTAQPETSPSRSPLDDALAEIAALTDEEAVARVEMLPGAYHKRMMAEERRLRTWPSYVRFCRGLLNTWAMNRHTALEAARSARE